MWGSPSLASAISGVGTLAEHIVVPAHSVTIEPAGVPFAEATGFNEVGQTAMKMMHKAGVKGGQRVPVNGASGGVCTMSVQLTKNLGARGVASCSRPDIEMIKGLGPDNIILMLRV